MHQNTEMKEQKGPMKIISKNDSSYQLRLDRGEEFVASLSQLIEKNKVPSCALTALGACDHVVLSWYNLETKQYQDKTFDENLEILNVTGNVSWFEGKLVVHAHGVFGSDKYQLIGGHIKEMRISATCEVNLQVLPDKIERAFDEETGLNLMKS